MRSDSDIKHNVEAELRCCPDVDETDIAVKVTGGTVTLTGYVRNFFHKYGAEDAVKRVAGVVAIANDIQVQASAAVSDPELAREAVEVIKRQLPLYWDQIRPIVHQGSVTLQGVVDANYPREEAEGAVRRVRRVVSVVNAIGLAPGAQSVRPEDVKRLIEESFRRSGRGAVSDINVEANGTGVTLRGGVRTWAERSQAERSASSAQGVQSVRNEVICKEKCHESDPLGTIHRNG
jgi:osmotically-inducible protein OsmY